MNRFLKFILTTGGFALLAQTLSAFSLLGPSAQWMTSDLGYQQTYDVGGPMALTNEYRWNVPLLTYGFDQSFLDYFGAKGSNAVEQAIKVLNAIPAAANLNLANYPTNVLRYNPPAETGALLDLKSATLTLLLEAMGLADSQRFLWTLRSRTIETNEGAVSTNFVVYQRNYDPVNLALTNTINRTAYSYQIVGPPQSPISDAYESVLPFSSVNVAVSHNSIRPGAFFTGLSRDDVGGWRYLYRRTNYNMEATIDGVMGPAANPTNFVRVTRRAGVEKITFQLLKRNTNGFVAITNTFTDWYFTNGALRSQSLRRIIRQPDILFTARDLGVESYYPHPPRLFRIGLSTNWINYSALNSNSSGLGPGVLQPTAEIAFNELGRFAGYRDPSGPNSPNWASFDLTTNAPVVFRGSIANFPAIPLGVRLASAAPPGLEWTHLARFGDIYRLESSMNLSDWSTNSLWQIIDSNGELKLLLPVDHSHLFFRLRPNQ